MNRLAQGCYLTEAQLGFEYEVIETRMRVSVCQFGD